jgi:hypothetical protein
MRCTATFLVLSGAVCLGAATAQAQQPAKTAPPKKAVPAAKAPARQTTPPPAPGTTRLYPAFRGYDKLLLLRPPSDSSGSCLQKTDWTRKLEGDLNGTAYAVSLRARSQMARPPIEGKVRESDIPPGKIRVSLWIKRETVKPLPSHYVERLNEWAKKYVSADAPPAPDPSDYDQWRLWASIHRDRFKRGPSTNLLEGMEPPRLGQLDEEFRRQGLPVRGETLLASVVFDTQAREKLLRTTVEGPDPDAQAGDNLILSVEQLEGYSCVFADADGSVYVDLPKTPLTENEADAAHRVYVISGTLLNPAGEPLAGKEVLFLPVDAEGRGLTVFDAPSTVMANPSARTNAEGRFTLRVAARFFRQSAEPGTGRVQMVEPMGPGRLRDVGKGIPVKVGPPGETRINLGRVVVAAR